jgi:hypothetical protein
MQAYSEPAKGRVMASALSDTFRILSEREIKEILAETAGPSSQEVARDRRARTSLFSVSGLTGPRDDGSSSYPPYSPEFDEGPGYWGTWGTV